MEIAKEQKITIGKKQFLGLKQKAMLLDEVVSFIEDKQLGYLMKETEKEENISLEQTKELLKDL